MNRIAFAFSLALSPMLYAQTAQPKPQPPPPGTVMSPVGPIKRDATVDAQLKAAHLPPAQSAPQYADITNKEDFYHLQAISAKLSQIQTQAQAAAVAMAQQKSGALITEQQTLVEKIEKEHPGFVVVHTPADDFKLVDKKDVEEAQRQQQLQSTGR